MRVDLAGFSGLGRQDAPALRTHAGIAAASAHHQSMRAGQPVRLTGVLP